MPTVVKSVNAMIIVKHAVYERHAVDSCQDSVNDIPMRGKANLQIVIAWDSLWNSAASNSLWNSLLRGICSTVVETAPIRVSPVYSTIFM
jgi:hypothetical protein